MFTPSLSTPHPFRGPSFRRFGGASGSNDVEPDRFRRGAEAVGVETAKSKCQPFGQELKLAVAPGIVSSLTVPLATDVDAFKSTGF